MKIAFFELEGWEEKIIRANFPNEELSFFDGHFDDLTPPPKNEFDVVSIFVDSKITPKTLARFPNLKFLTTRSTGYDHIDLKALKKRNVQAAYVPGYGDNTVAEFAFGLILNLTRKIYLAIDQVKEIESFDLKNLRGMDLKNKTIGVVGTGRIGKEVIRIAKGFGLNVLAYDPFPKNDLAKLIGYEYVSLTDLLKNSDIVTIHCPYNRKTRHLLNKKNIKFVKRGAYLVNTARGGIVETEALVLALNEGILAGAALDVLEEEGETKDEMKFLSAIGGHGENLRTILENHILMKMPNVLITPHNAFNSQEALERILNTTIQNIKSFLAGRPENLVP
ncbi:MAG: hypothetical protein UY23_C0001G0382 [Candidatus Jorgensenbacteria bacterium GW2011_GWA1_48_11]|uniref:D-isomer specific 2-hydroxyacid dehydrogenase NAD-binding protein n=1 Tax=Candidatus Jorgensenbacteria bacterium GW2011_GWA1_48_11 TaxID=1618660 RepID=A0A0G1UCA3_9BACT|nr:MAG: hypothetical protein UY23_C0001G0382 [Candidatus Jorgensenbacteria bacterium GW2011_GWA1_48_11]KKW12267.1 MAG: hypothetical protein UY51_C0005G0509 [Candidatus Jorgensenbacteria bacterium GW2011_GWB1_49_9]